MSEEIDRFVRRLCEYSINYMNRSLDYIELKNAVMKFHRLNPDADYRTIDWVAYWDNRLRYAENIRNLARAYPGYRWFAEEEDSEEGLEAQRRSALWERVRELNDQDVVMLVEMIRKEFPHLIGPEDQGAEPKSGESAAQQIHQPVTTLAKLSRYPFTRALREFVSAFSVEDLVPLAGKIRERLLEALERGERGTTARGSAMEDVLTFIGAKVVALATGDDWLLRRWALAESSRIERALLQEATEELLKLFREELGIRCERVETSEERRKGGGSYKVRLPDYLRLAKELDGAEWRLVNRTVNDGWVYVSRTELIRLARSAIVEKLMKTDSRPKLSQLPKQLAEVVFDIMKEVTSRFRKFEVTEFQGEDDWPPCMRALKTALLSGGKVGHFGNFAVATFLLSTGHTVDDVIGVYAQRADFDERVARYQIEHIAGLRGSRTKYTVPSCQTMRTHGLCIENGRLCPANIKNPMQFRPRKS